VDRRVKDGLRAGATAVGVAASLLVLASTAQTPDGFVHASFGGPLDVFGTTSSDVFAIGDGASDASELAALLKTSGAAPVGNPEEPFRVTVQDGESSNATTVNVFPTIDPTIAPATTEDVPPPPAKPAVDASGRVDCTGAVSCKTDPVTKATTVTYPDGVVATVQKVNDLTVVAYERIGKTLRADVRAILQPAPETAAPTLAAPAPAPEPAPDPSQPITSVVVPAPAGPDQQEAIPAIDLGPLAPDADILDPGIDLPRGPRVDVTRPPADFGPADGTDAGPSVSPPSVPKMPKIPGLGKVKEAFGSVVDAVKDGISKAVGPGAAGKPGNSGQSSPADAGAGSQSP
jgi:hypothetical protein